MHEFVWCEDDGESRSTQGHQALQLLQMEGGTAPKLEGWELKARGSEGPGAQRRLI